MDCDVWLSQRKWFKQTLFNISKICREIKNFSRAVRRHWAVENQVHWILDVAFKEDLSRVRIQDVAENFSVIRRIALNLLRTG